MPKVTVLFWDVGGVLLSNGWDEPCRREAVRKFGLDWEDFEGRHQLIVTAFEIGEIGLKEYLERTVFYRPRAFTEQDFKNFLFSLPRPCPGTLAMVERLSQSKRYLLATLNNESLELNLYRISRFGLRNYFDVFFSSCFLGVRKPDEAIFHRALQMTQRSPEESVFIDDRAVNVDCARRIGMRAIRFQDAAQLRHDLRESGVEI